MKKPFQTYNGGKESDGTYQKIINQIPPHDLYIEPFFGNGAIYRYKKSAFISSIGIDLDAAVINEWNRLSLDNLTLINTDALLWLELFSSLASILKNIGVRVLIYNDPPYPRHTWKNQTNKLYEHELMDSDHERLLNILSRINANVIISSYPNQLYSDLLKEWKTFTFQSQTRSGTATEQIWMNYPEPKELHDYSYIGNDYREREQLKGIVSRNVSKFKRLPDLQRNAIIQQLQKEKIL